MADIVITVVGKLAEYTVAPVLRQFGYLIYYKSNVKDLTVKVTTLTAKRDWVHQQREAAGRNLEAIPPLVDDWLNRVKETIEKTEECFEKGGVEKATTFCSSNGWCPNLKVRHSLSRKAAKLALEAKALLTEDVVFRTVSCPAPHQKLDYPVIQYPENSTPEGVSSSYGTSNRTNPPAPMSLSERLEYRLPYTKDLLTALQDDKIGMMGISGTFKEIDTITTKEFIKRMKQRNLFEEVVVAVASQDPDYGRIQGDIAEMLDMKLEIGSSVERAKRLRAVLLAPDSKRFLVILTDVCGILDFEAIGISHVDIKKRCKIMLVSQVSNVFGEMGTWNNFKLLVPPTPIARPVEFESRISVIRGVMDALTDDESNPIVVCGMWYGGYRENNLGDGDCAKAAEVDLFDEIAIAEFSEEPDLFKIQGKLAKDLGLVLKEDDDRAAMLRERLSGGAKRKLIILDNVWTQLDLWKIGIPISRNPKSCKVLVSSRDLDLFKEMKTKRNFFIAGLPEDEAWDLFNKMAGGFTESEPELCDIAKQVLTECGGLPVAISTDGKALIGRDITTWKDALRQLKQACPEDVPRVIEDVYGKIELSYNCLPSQQAKSCFLLCGIFRRIEDLIVSGMGFGLFKGIYSISAGRNYIKALVGILRGRSLLLEGDDNEEIRMHDAVRDVAVHIASKVWKLKKNDPLQQIVELDDRLKDYCTLTTSSSTTELLLLEGYHSYHWDNNKLELPATIFDGMEDLKVLIIRNSSLPSLPLLKKLQTLVLENCKLKFDGEVIGELRTLMVLDLSGSNIKKLPNTFQNLSNLRLLNVSECEELYVISPGVISKLFRLEELYMWDCSVALIIGQLGSTKTTTERISKLEEVDMWERLNRCAVKILASEELSDDDDKEVGEPDCDQWNSWAKCMDWNVGVLSELLSSTGLTTLEVCLPPVEHLLTGKLFHNLETFKISITWDEDEDIRYHPRAGNYLRVYDLDVISLVDTGIGSFEDIRYHPRAGNYLRVYDLDVISLVDTGIGSLFNKTETLELKMNKLTDPLNVLGVNGCEKLESLTLEDCGSLEYLIDMRLGKHIPRSIFPVLNEMEITGAGRLKEFFHGNLPPGSLQKLEALKISELPALATIWSIETDQSGSVGDLASLESLQINDCQSLEAIIYLEGSAHHAKEINFSALTMLVLEGLLSFTGISKCTSNRLDQQLEVRSPCLNSLTVDDSLFSDPKVVFPVLSYLEITGLGELKKIWNSQSTPASFSELKDIMVKQCDKLLHLGPIQIMQDRLQSLENIYIINCSLEVIFEVSALKINESHASIFPSDKMLPNTSQPDQGMEIHAIMDFKPSCQGFQNLTELRVVSCGSLRYLLSPSVARGLVKLRILQIENCQKMVAVVATGECEDREEVSREALLPQLCSLDLSNLPNLESFAQEKYTFDWPLVERISIQNCSKMNTFCSGSLSIARKNWIDVSDSGENLKQELYDSRKES
ncbi:LOW QUALITY PROTEIN: uncharacterized protein LOC126784053 [Argentina anserina]|uniref:LOW QUALITY PROTEIN: uncharacterized protein LOC126784053 n=1 Tax=Argentina anserina TaxID=57926 RepID=UPI00217641E4|nr:LOW QUALITY PROTEIN: uncharacterized protein LOC126784053 [Potentilla anserina]